VETLSERSSENAWNWKDDRDRRKHHIEMIKWQKYIAKNALFAKALKKPASAPYYYTSAPKFLQ